MPSSSPNPSGSITPDSLTPEREAEIGGRAAAATPGPWTVDLEQCDCSDGLCSHGTYVAAIYADGERRSEFDEIPDADWQFIAHAREDVPALLAEVDRLRARVAELERAAGAGRASLANLMRDHEDPGAAAFGALSMLNQATPAVEAQFDEAAEVLNRRDAAVLDSAADELAERQERLASAYADSDITGDGPEAVLNAWQQAEDEVRHLASKAVSA